VVICPGSRDRQLASRHCCCWLSSWAAAACRALLVALEACSLLAAHKSWWPKLEKLANRGPCLPQPALLLLPLGLQAQQQSRQQLLVAAQQAGTIVQVLARFGADLDRRGVAGRSQSEWPQHVPATSPASWRVAAAPAAALSLPLPQLAALLASAAACAACAISGMAEIRDVGVGCCGCIACLRLLVQPVVGVRTEVGSISVLWVCCLQPVLTLQDECLAIAAQALQRHSKNAAAWHMPFRCSTAMLQASAACTTGWRSRMLLRCFEPVLRELRGKNAATQSHQRTLQSKQLDLACQPAVHRFLLRVC